MKNKSALLFLLTVFMMNAKAQRVEQYCEMTYSAKAFTKKVVIDIDFGEERKTLKDYRVKDSMGKVKLFNSVVDAMNYLGQLGWKLVNAYPVREANQNIYHYVFKKEFDVLEVKKNPTSED